MQKKKRKATPINNNPVPIKRSPESIAAANSRKTKRILITIVCILLAVVIIFATTLGIISALKNASYLAHFEGIGIDKGVASYLVSYYKTQYMASLKVEDVEPSDTEGFWNLKVYKDYTYGDYLRISTETYIRQLISANRIFDKYTSLSKSDREQIAIATNEILEYRAGGSKDTFNAATAKYGFDFSDFVTATEMIYKGWSAKTKIFGANGENMVSFPEECENYYKAYSHVNLLFVRTEKKFKVDENGEYANDGNGNYVFEELSDEEKAEKQRRVEEIRRAVEGINASEIAPQRYFELLDEYDEGDRSTHTKGYYFYKNSEYTKEFASQFAEVVEAAEEMEIGKCVEVDTSIGKCFIYKMERAEGAYLDTSDKWCFSDFYSMVSDSVYEKMINEYKDKVELRDKWKEINVITIPKNTDFIARF